MTFQWNFLGSSSDLKRAYLVQMTLKSYEPILHPVQFSNFRIFLVSDPNSYTPKSKIQHSSPSLRPISLDRQQVYQRCRSYSKTYWCKSCTQDRKSDFLQYEQSIIRYDRLFVLYSRPASLLSGIARFTSGISTLIGSKWDCHNATDTQQTLAQLDFHITFFCVVSGLGAVRSVGHSG